MNSPGGPANNNINRQESHRIYLQLFTPQSSTSTTAARSPPQQQLHRHDSHQIHPPNYPMTTPGAPYRFSSSTSLSNESSVSFSSSSVHPISSSSGGGGVNNTSNSSTTSPAAHNNKKRYIQQPVTITTSAAVRLTDRAFARDVTSLLRGKFGLPQPTIVGVVDPNNNATNSSNNSPQRAQKGLSPLTRRLSPSSRTRQQQQQQQE
mmetsp:Transcript_5222/g.8626  ORF Transcript_5222/g.8626 Transcript_5222/m.8626 type:complete len:206 (-) Transcript_5222:1609-2226(-)